MFKCIPKNLRTKKPSHQNAKTPEQLTFIFRIIRMIVSVRFGIEIFNLDPVFFRG
jgi:hypothetical protein